MSLSTIRKMTLRLNMEEPKQAEIYQILTSLDKYIYKSQNQFLVDALEFYIEHSGKDTLTQQEQAEQQRYITAEELEQIKKELRGELLEEMRNELLKLLGQYAAGAQNPMTGQIKALTEQTDEMELENDTEEESSVVGNLACRWMGDLDGIST